MTSTDYNYVESTGVIVPDTSTLLADVTDEYQVGFQRTDLVTAPGSPAGVLVNAETVARASVLANNTQLANQINPNIAGGTFLDALLAFTGMTRVAQVQTVVTNVTVTGVPTTVIPQGSQAQTGAGDLFATLGAVTIPPGGSTLVSFASVNYGPIPCASTALNQIVSNVPGWETVSNDGSGMPASVTTLGSTTQSDQAARALRNNTLAFQGVSLAEAITSALYATAGVTSLFFQENVSDITETIMGISMKSHSVYACVAGGSDTDVAAALLENKSSGGGWNGGTSVAVMEPASGQIYTVSFDRPTPVGILIQVVSPNGNSANIIQAILDYAAGLIETTDQNGSSGTMPGWVVGAAVSPFELAAAIIAENPGYIITSVEVSLLSPVSYSTSTIALAVNAQAYTQASYITVNA